MEENCIFCKIIEGKIPSKTVYENEYVKAILDVSPAARGHVIVLAKCHAANIFELPDDYASQIMIAAKKIAIAQKQTYSCDGVNILQNNGECAGQSVFHLHVHVIPRWENDGIVIKCAAREATYDLEEVKNELVAAIEREV